MDFGLFLLGTINLIKFFIPFQDSLKMPAMEKDAKRSHHKSSDSQHCFQSLIQRYSAVCCVYDRFVVCMYTLLSKHTCVLGSEKELNPMLNGMKSLNAKR